MKLLPLLTLSTALLLQLPVYAADPTEKDAIAMVDKGAAYLKAHGKDELIRKVAAKDPDFLQGTLYIDVRDLATGIVLAHPVNASIVGKDLTDMPDASGKKYRREIIDLAAKKRPWLGRLPVQKSCHRQDRTENHLHPAGRRCGAGSGHL